MNKIRLEAESLTLKGYVFESTSAGSGGARAKLPSGTGSISTILSPTFTEGLYNITISYYDENDGRSAMELRVGGILVDSWVMNQDPAVPAGFVQVQRTVSVSQQLRPGSTIELKGIQNQGEFARVDYIELERVGSVPPPPNPGNSSGGVILNLNTNVELSPVFGSQNIPRLMPLGDSITAGAHSAGAVPGAYRIQFWNRAVADGLAIDFVGSKNNQSGSLADGDHAGFPGRTIEQTTSWVRSGNLPTYPAEAILLMIGTNDSGNASGTEMRNRLSTLIDEITSAVPNTYLLVSPITPVDAPRGTAAQTQNIALYNSLMPALVAQKASQGKKVYYAEAGNTLAVGDINGDNSSTNDVNDGLHPTASGYTKLGNAWYDKVFNPKPLTGNDLNGTQFADRLIGNSSANVLKGNGGEDLITGGGGADVFAYDESTHGLDVITDFSSDDIFRVSAARFGGGLMSGMSLDFSSFIAGSNPLAAGVGGTFLYNTGNNTLSFDKDGAGTGAALGIATLANGYNLQSSQIQISA